MSPIPPGQSTFQLRVQLQDIRPIIWRRLLVPGAAHLPKFANMLCAAMGWQNYHLHQFRVGKAGARTRCVSGPLTVLVS